ncbi:MAG: hypothetical protein ABSB84_03470 [Verrucomicrobiota bacterium]
MSFTESTLAANTNSERFLALPVPTDFSAKIPMKAAGEIFLKRVVREKFTHRA